MMQRLAIAALIACLLAWGAAPLALGQSPEASPAGADSPGPRVIGIEMMGGQRFRQDGEKARDIPVVPGETIVFRVDNTSGVELDFHIGTENEIAESRSDTGIPGWTTGVRELTWTVPDRLIHLRFGSNDGDRPVGTFSKAIMSPNGAIEPAPEAGPTPTPKQGRPRAHIAHSDQAFFVFDAAYAGFTTAVAWRADSDPWDALSVTLSSDAELRSLATRAVADHVGHHAVAICDGDAVVAFQQRIPGEGRQLHLARVPAGGGPISSVMLQPVPSKPGSIDVACTRGRVFVAWTQRLSSEWHAFVRAVRASNLEPSQVRDLGVARRHRIAVATAGDHALVAWSGPRGIRLKRFRIADEPGNAVTALRTRTVATLSRSPILAADGDQVLLGLDHGDEATILISRDAGVTFPQRERIDRTMVPVASLGEFASLAVEGRHIVATMFVIYGGDAWGWHRVRSRDMGRTWTQARISRDPVWNPQDGFLVTSKGVKLVETLTDDFAYAPDWDLRVRRER